MKLVQKNVTVPAQTWVRLRENAQESGLPLCIFLTYLAEESQPVSFADPEAQKKIERIQMDRENARAD